MSRTRGAVDRKKRKERSDKRHKGIREIKLEKRIGNKTHLKLWWWEKKPMSYESRMRWNEKARAKIHPFVYHFGIRVDSPIEELATKKLLEQWALNNIGYDGEFIVMGVSRSFKSKRGFKWVKLFSVRITGYSTGLRAKLIRNYRMFRYKWIWRDR